MIGRPFRKTSPPRKEKERTKKQVGYFFMTTFQCQLSPVNGGNQSLIKIPFARVYGAHLLVAEEARFTLLCQRRLFSRLIAAITRDPVSMRGWCIARASNLISIWSSACREIKTREQCYLEGHWTGFLKARGPSWSSTLHISGSSSLGFY